MKTFQRKSIIKGWKLWGELTPNKLNRNFFFYQFFAIIQLKMTKKTIYQIIKFLIMSFFIIYFLYIKGNFPISLIIVFEVLLVAKTLPITEFIKKKIIEYFPRYQSFNIWMRRLILLIVWFLIYAALKFIIIDIFMMQILHIPVEQQIYEFMEHMQQ